MLFACAVGASAQDPAPERPSGWTEKKPVVSKRFMVAAANPLAVDAGYAILRQGGSAVDAAIAVQLVLGLVEAQSSGIGGGAFMLVHDAKRNKLIAYDGRETAPAAAKPDRFLDAEGKPLAFHDAVIGGRSVGVPGVVALLAEAHKRHGKLPWARLFAPAIELAENGFPVSERLNAMVGRRSDIEQPRARALFLRLPRQPVSRRADGAQSRVRGDAAQDRSRRREGVLRGSDRARHRRHRERPPRRIPAT